MKATSTEDAVPPIAVVGMGCRFPGAATNPETLWQMVLDGESAWSEFPEERLNIDGYFHPSSGRQGSIPFRGAHFLKQPVDVFDASFFGISAEEAKAMDPQQRMLLEVTYEALENAGIPKESVDGKRIGVYIGVFVKDYEQIILRDMNNAPQYAATGTGAAILSNRLSHFFNLSGPSMTIDTGCSGSLISIHQACQSLRHGESEMAIAGGAALILTPSTMMPMTSLGFLSPDGKCFTFDERANGYGRGEGIGVVLLKRLEDAIRDNDTIRGVIRGTRTNQDGKTPGITLPSAEAQAENIRGVYKEAGLSTHQTAFVECHGTGTKAGDWRELNAISEALGTSSRTSPIVVGSIKTNLGHLEGSAGVAGFIKGLLAVERGVIPRHLNFENPNPDIRFEKWNVKVPTEMLPWPLKGLRRASINCFGFGGSNCHAIVDDAGHYLAERGIAAHHNTVLEDAGLRSLPPSTQLRRPLIFLYSAHDEAGVSRVMLAHRDYLLAKGAKVTPEFLASYAYTLNCRRSQLSYRAYIIAVSAQELIAKLEHPQECSPSRTSGTAKSVAWIFCGQGAQWFAMGRELLRNPVFEQSISEADRYLKEELGSSFSLLEELNRDEKTTQIHLPSVSQPATTALQVALVDLLKATDLDPTAVVGHSSGEIAAVYAAGGLSKKDAWKLAFYRGRCAASLKEIAPWLKGGMLAVGLSIEGAEKVIAEAEAAGDVFVACHNSPESVTLSGDLAALARVADLLKKSKTFHRKLAVDIPYHSHHLKLVEKDYLSFIRDIPLQPSDSESDSRPVFFSSVRGAAYDTRLLDHKYWIQNLVGPVKFSETIANLLTSNAFSSTRSKTTWSPSQPDAHSPQAGQESTRVQLGHTSPTGLPQVCELSENTPQETHDARDSQIKATRLSDHEPHHRVDEISKPPPALLTHTSSSTQPHFRENFENIEQDSFEVPSEASSIVFSISRSLDGAEYPSTATSVSIPVLTSTPDILLEISPHSALKSPIQQILTSKQSDTAYLSLLDRNQAADITILSACGNIWKRGININIDPILTMSTTGDQSMAGRYVLTDLPPYLWDHTKPHWHESQLSLANRFRGHARQDIIGSPTDDSTDELPKWQTYLRTSEVPWLCDHKVDGAVVYPAAGMVAMAIQGAHQKADRTRVLHGFEVNDLDIRNPMVVSLDHAGLEVRMAFWGRIHGSQSLTYSFALTGAPVVKGAGWTSQKLAGLLSSDVIFATGSVTVHYTAGDEAQTQTAASSPAVVDDDNSDTGSNWDANSDQGEWDFASEEEAAVGDTSPAELKTLEAYHGEYLEAALTCTDAVDTKELYDRIGTLGIQYGTTFANVVELKTSPSNATQVTGTVKVPDTAAVMPMKYEFPIIIHPATLDAVIHTAFGLGSDEPMLPTASQRIFVSANVPWRAGELMHGLTHGHVHESNGTSADYIYFPEMGTEPVIIIDKLRFSPVGLQANKYLPDHSNLCTEMVWAPDSDYMHTDSLRNFLGHFAYKRPDAFHLQVGGGAELAVSVLESISVQGIICAGALTLSGEDCASLREKALGMLEENRRENMAGLRQITHAREDSQIKSDPLKYDTIYLGNDAGASIVDDVKGLLKTGGMVLVMKSDELDRGMVDAGYRATLTLSETGLPPVTLYRDHAKPRINGKEKTVYAVLLDEASNPVLEAQIRSDLPRALLAHGYDVHFIPLSSIVTMPENSRCISFLTADSADNFPNLLNQVTFQLLKELCRKFSDLVWVTRDCEGDNVDSSMALMQGLLRTIRSESGKTVVAVDMNRSVNFADANTFTTLGNIISRSFSELNTNGREETEYHVSGRGEVLIPRLVPLFDLNQVIMTGNRLAYDSRPLREEVRTLALIVNPSIVMPAEPYSDDGRLDCMGFAEDKSSSRSLEPLEVRIQTELAYVGGVDMSGVFGTVDNLPFGTDMVGTVVEAGSASKIALGERVVAMARGTVRNNMIVHSALVRPCEVGSEYTPTPFVTAHYALENIGQMDQDSRVLVLHAASPVGQAAVRLCQVKNATVYAAIDVGSRDQAQALRRNLGIQMDQMMEMVDIPHWQQFQLLGLKPVDIIINAVEKDCTFTTSVLSYDGRYIQVYDSLSGISLRPFRPVAQQSVAFVDIWAMARRAPNRVAQAFSQVDTIATNDGLKYAMPRKTFSFSQIPDAFQHALRYKDFGQVILKVNDNDHVPILNSVVPPAVLGANDTYLLIGGLGGLGQHITKLMVTKGAKHLVFLSRSGGGEPEKAFVKAIKRLGVNVANLQADIEDKEAIRSAFASISDGSFPPFKGAVQCAVQLRDGMLDNMSFRDWMAPQRAKVDGTRNLVELLPKDMDFFIFLSSASGIIGNRAQSNYAAANTFLDGLAREGARKGLRTTSLDLGPLLNIGMVANDAQKLESLQRSGFIGIRTDDFELLMDRAMAGCSVRNKPLPPRLIAGVGSGGLVSKHKPGDAFWARTSLFRILNRVDLPLHELGAAGGSSSGGGASRLLLGAGQDALLDRVAGLPHHGQRAGVVFGALAEALARELGMEPGEVMRDRSATHYGADSLKATNVTLWARRELKIQVSMFEVLDPSSTLGKLADDMTTKAVEGLAQRE